MGTGGIFLYREGEGHVPPIMHFPNWEATRYLAPSVRVYSSVTQGWMAGFIKLRTVQAHAVGDAILVLTMSTELLNIFRIYFEL